MRTIFLSFLIFFLLTCCTTPSPEGDTVSLEGGTIDYSEKAPTEKSVPSSCKKSKDCIYPNLECTFLGKCSDKQDKEGSVGTFRKLVQKYSDWRCKKLEENKSWFYVIELAYETSQVVLKKGHSDLLLDVDTHGAIFRWKSKNFKLKGLSTVVSGTLIRSGTGFRAETKKETEKVDFVCGPDHFDFPFFKN